MENGDVPRVLSKEEIELIVAIRKSVDPPREIESLISYREELLRQHGKQRRKPLLALP